MDYLQPAPSIHYKFKHETVGYMNARKVCLNFNFSTMWHHFILLLLLILFILLMLHMSTFKSNISLMKVNHNENETFIPNEPNEKMVSKY